MDAKFGARRATGMLRSRPKILLALGFMCGVFLWITGSAHYRQSHSATEVGKGTWDPQAATTKFRPLPPKATVHDQGGAGVEEQEDDENEAASPVPTSQSSIPKLKHYWGVPKTSHHLWGEGERNRTQIGKEKASLVMLVRNKEQKEALMAMKQIEDRFNRHYRYPWTFLNDEPFTDDFKLQTSRMASGEAQYGLIPKEHWSIPEWIDQDKFRQKLKEFKKKKIIYGESESYRHMCRFNSGFFWRNELLKHYDWYWRVEPGTSFYCDQLYDPFTFMRENNKRYSFVMTLYEYRATIETLWQTTREFATAHPDYIAENNALDFMIDDYKSPKSLYKQDYNLCHFWSNFEIADLNLWRSKEYQDYFNFLDKKGGFFYERWGDAPVHSIAASLFLPKDQIHFFHDMGYNHPPYQRCPQDAFSHDTARCMCPFNYVDSFDFDGYSCQKKWWKVNGQDESGNPIPQDKIPDF